MRKIVLALVVSVSSITVFAQSQNITTSAIALRQYNSEKDLDRKKEKIIEAKEYIDLAFLNSSTSNEPKMWMVRAKVYKMIAFNHPLLDKDAIFKATYSHIQCMQPHPKKKNKIIIFKKWPEEEVFEGLMQCANKLFNLSVAAYEDGRFQESLDLYGPIYTIIDLDKEGKLKDIKITTEALTYNSYLAAKAMNISDLSKNLVKKLIKIKSTKPIIYSEISSIYLQEDSIDYALDYLEEGRKIFPDNQGLMNDEINLYMKLNRTDDLIVKISDNIKDQPGNESYYVVRGNCYQSNDKIDSAILDYQSALNINPDNLIALNNISSCYLKKTEPIYKRKEKLSYNSSKHARYDKDLETIHKLILPYLEHYVSIEPEDKQMINILGKIYYKLEMFDKEKSLRNR